LTIDFSIDDLKDSPELLLGAHTSRLNSISIPHCNRVCPDCARGVATPDTGVETALDVEGNIDVETAIDNVGEVNGAILLLNGVAPAAAGPVVDALAVTPRTLPTRVQKPLLAFPKDTSEGSAVESHRTHALCRAS